MVEVEFQTTKVLALFHIKIIIISICGSRIFTCVPTRRCDLPFYLFMLLHIDSTCLFLSNLPKFYGTLWTPYFARCAPT